MKRDVLCIITAVTEIAPHARGDFAAFLAPRLVTGLGLMASRAEAAPFLYVANGSNPGTVSVIDTATNMVVATITVGSSPGIAVTPDRKHVYVTNPSSNSVSVIDTATNTVVKTITVGSNPFGVAITPDGKHAYVANFLSNQRFVSVIDTATNMVVATVAVGGNPAASPPPPTENTSM